ncbi:MAG: hypothetical protein JW740_00670 [Candidatus Zambryskibacteria bacterium]|nr:hypothetical protein [Candidatus Zambryskibacteria bacterium]
MEDKNYQAIVEKVISGRHGEYCHTRSKELGSVTFSLDVWQEKIKPEPGTYVMLSQVFKKRAGWRAASARFLQPSDETRED